MKKNEIYTHKYGAIPAPSPWVMPGIDIIEGSVDAFRYVIDMVCLRYELEESVAMGKSRKREHVKARQIIHSLLKTNFNRLSLKKIGEACGGKDHATVMHSCRSVSNQVDTDKEYREEYNELNVIVKSNINRFKQTHTRKKH
jgi:chromosomal replication initiator protein